MMFFRKRNRAIDLIERLISQQNEYIGALQEEQKRMQKYLKGMRETVPNHRHDVGSLEGGVRAIKPFNDGYVIEIWCDLHECRVFCFISADFIDLVLQNFNNRIEVKGTISYEKLGTPQSVICQEVNAFPKDDDLPSIASMEGILSARVE